MPEFQRMRRPRIRITRGDVDALNRFISNAPQTGSVMALLEDELGRAAIVEGPGDGSFCRIGDGITYEDEETGQARSVRLVMPQHADADSRSISVLTPVGSALLGLAPGARFDWIDNRGRRRRLKVISIASHTGPEASLEQRNEPDAVAVGPLR